MKSNTLKPLNTAIVQCNVNLKVVIRLRHDGLIEVGNVCVQALFIQSCTCTLQIISQ